MWDEVRDRITQLLMHGNTGVICAMGTDAPNGMAVRYRSDGLELACLLPQWTDVACALEARPQVVLLIAGREGMWVRYQGLAHLVAAADWHGRWPDDPPRSAAGRWIVAHITPRRIDLVDDASTWRVRETLELW